MFKPIENALFYSFYNIPKREMFFGNYKKIIEKLKSDGFKSDGFETYKFQLLEFPAPIVEILFYLNDTAIHKGRICAITDKEKLTLFEIKELNRLFNCNFQDATQITDFQFKILVASLS